MLEETVLVVVTVEPVVYAQHADELEAWGRC